MNYNQFYRKKDKERRTLSPIEKQNAKRWGRSFIGSILVGMIAGLVIIVLIKVLG